jgi:hypothetical protein
MTFNKLKVMMTLNSIIQPIIITGMVFGGKGNVRGEYCIGMWHVAM